MKFLLPLVMLLSGCAVMDPGPQGGNEGDAMVGAVAAATRVKNQPTVVRGRVFLRSATPIPVRGKKVELIDGEGRALAHGWSGPDGVFRFSGKIADGSYVLQVDGKQNFPLEVKGYRIEGVDLFVD